MQLKSSPNLSQFPLGDLLGASWGLLGASWTPALEASPFKTRNGGSPECEGSVAHFCLILAVLGCLLVSFWLSWDAFGPHFASLRASWGGFLAQVGPSWPKIAKKIDFLNLTSGSGTKLGPKLAQDPPKSRPKPEKSDIEKQHSLDIDFGRVQASFWKGLGQGFGFQNARQKRTRELCKNLTKLWPCAQK